MTKTFVDIALEENSEVNQEILDLYNNIDIV